MTALEPAPDPRPADLDPPVRVIDGSEAGRARDLVAGDVDRRERERPAFGLLAQRRLDVTAQLLPRLDRRVPSPQVGIEPDRAQSIEMPLRIEGSRLGWPFMSFSGPVHRFQSSVRYSTRR